MAIFEDNEDNDTVNDLPAELDVCQLQTSRTVEFADRVEASTRFSTQESHFLRGINVKRILSSGGRAFSNNIENQCIYEKSKAVDEIDVFISHNWVVDRSKKFFALALHFNLKSAVVAALVSAILGWSLNVAGIMNIEGVVFAHEEEFSEGVWIRLLCTPVFLCMLFTRHDIVPERKGNKTCFLDKACIHQTDTELKRKAIAKIGAFLANSGHFLILYTDIYFRKLWTVYEVACFLRVKPSDRLDVLHMSNVKLFYLFLISLYVTTILELFFRLLDLPSLVVWFLVWTTLLFYALFLCQRGVRSLVATWKELESFEVQQATCFEESDRDLVERNIQAFMTQLRPVESKASRGEALSAFNALVRTDILHLMKASVGTDPIHYSHLVMILCLTNFAAQLDIVSGMFVSYGICHSRPWLYLLGYTTMNFALIPLGAQAVFLLLPRLTLSDSRAFDVLGLIGCTLLCWLFLISSTVLALSFFLLPKAETSVTYFILFLLYCFLSLGCAVLCLILKWHRRHQLDGERSQQFRLSAVRSALSHLHLSTSSSSIDLREFGDARRIQDPLESLASDQSTQIDTFTGPGFHSKLDVSIQGLHSDLDQFGSYRSVPTIDVTIQTPSTESDLGNLAPAKFSL